MSDQSLAQYIDGLLRQGYSEQQVRQYLLQNNYPRSMVDAAFQGLGGGVQTVRAAPVQAQSPVVDQLISYLRTYLSQGYQVEQMRPYLIQQGYAQRDVDQAIATVTGQQTVRHEVHFPFATIVKLAFLLLIAFGLWFAYGLVFDGGDGPGPEPVSGTRIFDLLEPSGIKSTYEPGKTIDAKLELQNKGTDEKYDVLLKWQLLDKRNLVVKEGGETRSMRESLPFDAELDIPGDTPEGKYTFKVSATATGADPAIALASITIKDEVTPIDDGNGTIEIPDDGPPIIVIVDHGNDAEDTLLDAIDEAERGNSGGAEALCEGISNILKRDECLSAIAASDQDVTHCDKITDPNNRDNCYMPFVMNGDYTLCEKIEGSLYQDTCDKLKHISTLPPLDNATGPSINDFAS